MSKDDPAAAHLDAALHAALQSARQAWPALEPLVVDFQAHLRERVEDQGPPYRELDSLHAGDLLLAFGCARRAPAALTAFESQMLPAVRAALARWDPSFALVDEVAQVLRHRLLLADPGAAPRILEYSGRGPLTHWLRAAAVRVAIDLRREHPETSLADEDRLADRSTPLSDPELDFIKSHYRKEFSDAFRWSLEQLSSHERTLLKLHLLDGLTLDQMAHLYGAHRSSVARWLADARASLLDRTRDRLGAQLGVARTEMESLLGLLRSQLDVSINRFLRRGT